MSSEEPCSFDLRNLLATNTHQINVSELYGHVAKNDREERITIPGESMTVSVNDKFLLDKASDACTQLIASLWQLTVESRDAGQLVALPPFDASRIPRALVRMMKKFLVQALIVLFSPRHHLSRKPNGRSSLVNVGLLQIRLRNRERFGMKQLVNGSIAMDTKRQMLLTRIGLSWK